MPRGKHALLGVLALLAGCLSGCSQITPESTNGEPAARIRFTSPVVKDARLPPRYTCDGANIAPPLTWGTVPSETKEVALFALELRPSDTGHVSISVAWSMAGVDPALHRLAAGETPRGAFLEMTSSGARHYSVCPAKGQARQYEFAIFAVPGAIKVTPNISGLALLNDLAVRDAQSRAPASGQFPTVYKRA
jgi:phosphatidylethanolamine-binding protein (PEBP) family uncharacterized protein